MSSRRGRSRSRRRGRRRLTLPPMLPVLVAMAIGALVGAGIAPRVLAALGKPEAVDASRWMVLVPGLDEQVTTPSLGRGTRVAGGELMVVPHSFGRSDRLLPRDDRPIARLEIVLDPRSGPLVVNLVPPKNANAGITSLWLTPGGWEDPSGTAVAVPPDEPAVMVNDGGTVSAVWSSGSAPLTRQPPGSVELSAEDQAVRILSIRAEDAAGAVILDERWSDASVSVGGRLAVACAGSVIGLMAGLVVAGAGSLVGGLLVGALLLAPPAVVLLLPHAFWLEAVERLFLVRTSTWELAGMAVMVALFPLIGVAVLRSRLLRPPVGRSGDLPWAGWAAVVALAAITGSRDLHGMALLAAVLGALVLAAPMWLAYKGGLSRTGVLARDLPALVAVAMFGWGAGLLVALLWRLLLVVAMVPQLIKRAPRAGTDVLFLTALALPVSVEIALRATYLDEGWAASRLSGAELGAGEDASGVVPFWSSTCGDDAPVVWWFGGSSAGGAYQLAGQPAAFFPGRVHAALCDQGAAVRTVNFSNGGRDSYTFSRALPGLLAGAQPDLVVVYVGVNDVLTENSSKTRKQREQARAETEQTTGVLARVAERSRLISGASLFARPVADQSSDFVPGVPVADAEENLRTIISLVEQVGGRVLLVPELTRPSSPEPMAPYRTMQRRLAQDEASAEWFDVVGEMADQDPEGVFVDRNHLSKPGHEAVATRVTPAVRAMLPAGVPAPAKLP